MPSSIHQAFHTDVDPHAAEGLPWGGVHEGPGGEAHDVFGAMRTAKLERSFRNTDALTFPDALA